MASTRVLRSSMKASPAVTPALKAVKKANKPAKKKQPVSNNKNTVLKTETDSASGITRCSWCTKDPEYIYYHDHEWGVPVKTDDRLLFELVVLEGAQAGLNWLTILKKRQGYKDAFDNFDVTKVSAYGTEERERLLQDPNIIRNKLKIDAAIGNAKAFIKVQEEYDGSFGQYLWQFAPESPTAWRNEGNVCRDMSPESEAMSIDLKKRGFRFVGPTICYALMQSIGMVNDHNRDCFLYPKEQ
ncbi:DNA-3-methyladenine glycosylase I [Obelidium mucronatum]|nr:DNA-3-methyladenine glycosylase I [Obelidium mucronatum]